MAPKLDELTRAFEAKRLELRDNPEGLIPEQTLVLETVGGIDDLAKALRGLQLEWLGEYDIDDIQPDDDFYEQGHEQDFLPGRLYLILHNQEGLSQLLSLFESFKKNPAHPQFLRGRTSFRDLFLQLKDIHPWGHADRLRETGLVEDFQERVAAGQETMRIELELVPRDKSWVRTRAEKWVASLVEAAQGRVLARFEAVEDFAYHAILVELPIESVRHVIEDASVDLARSGQVLFIRPAGQAAERLPLEPPLPGASSPSKREKSVGTPVAALLDGLPLAQHEWLSGRLVVDDPENWEEQYPAGSRCHGTAMASLILHGELDTPGVPLSRPLYVRPVMKPDLGFRGPSESIPSDILPIDLIHSAVRRILARERGLVPAAPSVCIINLSLGDRWRPFDRFPSPWARLLDFLAARYRVLFVVSAGNHVRSLELDLPSPELEGLLRRPEELKTMVLRSVRRDMRHLRLLSPAEAINVLTVGALNADLSSLSHRGIDPLEGLALPALYSAQGPGFRRAVKPEVFFAGGRQIFREAFPRGEKATLEPLDNAGPPGQRVATPGGRQGDLGAVRYMRGTSNAAALVTRVACQLHEMVLALVPDAGGRGPSSDEMAVLLRALLVHGASWGERPAALTGIQDEASDDDLIGRVLGYGVLDPSRVLACTDQRVTLLGWGLIRSEQAFAYHLPLPESLNGSASWRRLVTTLAWFSPVNSYHNRYRRASLWLAPPKGKRSYDLLGLERQEVDHRAARRGTVQHEIFVGSAAKVYTENEFLTLQVNCQPDAGKLDASVPYGLVVTLETADGIGLPIYDEVQVKLRHRLAIRT
ncbi:MAG TPA: S8 family peptidase [Thermoanaerobaculia bacterium]|nr:S8 family peptidase [Thermoanaerobaculia bacterium]